MKKLPLTIILLHAAVFASADGAYDEAALLQSGVGADVVMDGGRGTESTPVSGGAGNAGERASLTADKAKLDIRRQGETPAPGASAKDKEPGFFSKAGSTIGGFFSKAWDFVKKPSFFAPAALALAFAAAGAMAAGPIGALTGALVGGLLGFIVAKAMGA